MSVSSTLTPKQQVQLLRGALLRCQTKIFLHLKADGWSDEEARSMFEMVLAKEALDASADWMSIDPHEEVKW